MACLNIQFDPLFVEEAVFVYIKSCMRTEKALISNFHNEREEIYNKEITAEERNRSFKNFYENYFEKAGLKERFEKMILEFPLLLRPDVLVFVKRVWTKKEEQVELFSQRGQKTIYIGLQVIRVLDTFFLETFLRHELMRMSDMLDPNFQYDPHIFLGGKTELEDNLIRDRFRILWDRDIHARLLKGFLSAKNTQEDLLRLACQTANDLPSVKEGVISCLEE